MTDDFLGGNTHAPAGGGQPGAPGTPWTPPKGDTGADASAGWGFLPDGMQAMQEGYTDPNAFWAGMSHLAGMAKEREAVTGTKPMSLVTEEEKAKLWKNLGRPDKADGYSLPETVTLEGSAAGVAEQVNALLQQDKAAMQAVFHTAGLTAEQANAMYQSLGSVLAEGMLAGEAKAPVDPQQVIQGLWPDNTAVHMEAAKRGAIHAGVGNSLDEKGLSVDPDVLKLAHALGEMVGEDGLRKSGSSAALPTGQEAKEAMHALIASEGYRKNDPSTMRKITALAERVFMK